MKDSWIISDVDQDIHVDRLRITSADVAGSAAGFAVTKRTLRGGLREGVEVIEVDNGAFSFVVIPTRGMGIWRAGFGDLALGWLSPVKGPVHPGFVRLSEANGLGWLDGFDELLVRCGLHSNGAPEFHPNGALRYGLHGHVANLPAHRVEISVNGDSGEIAVSGVVDESRLFGPKLRLSSTVITTVGRPGMTVCDTITNLSAEPGEMELLYHVNLGLPSFGPGAKVVLPLKQLAPRDAVAAAGLDHWDTCGPQTPKCAEAVFYCDLAAQADGLTMALLRNAEGNRGVSLRWNKRQLPCFSLWKNPLSEADGYVTGLEPGTNFPNVRSFESQRGRVVALAPGQSHNVELQLDAYGDAKSVAAAEKTVTGMQGDVAPNILRRPDPEWSKTA